MIIGSLVPASCSWICFVFPCLGLEFSGGHQRTYNCIFARACFRRRNQEKHTEVWGLYAFKLRLYIYCHGAHIIENVYWKHEYLKKKLKHRYYCFLVLNINETTVIISLQWAYAASSTGPVITPKKKSYLYIRGRFRELLWALSLSWSCYWWLVLTSCNLNDLQSHVKENVWKWFYKLFERQPLRQIFRK